MPERPPSSAPFRDAFEGVGVQSSPGEMMISAVDELDVVEFVGGDDIETPEGVDVKAKRRRRKYGIGFWLATTWMTVLIFCAIFASWLPFVDDPNVSDPLAFGDNAAPSADHWFGADTIGRDVLSRIIYGARVSLTIGVVVIAVGLLIGGTLGLIAGYWGGRLETTITAGADVMLAFPPLILALALIAVLGQDLWNVILALVVLSIPSLIRITRAATLTFSRREFVLASRTLGASNKRVIFREVLPNVVPPMASFALLAVAIVIVAEAALSFLGLSVKSPTPTWGSMIEEGKDVLDETPHLALIPCAVMFLTLVSINYIGDKLRAIWNVQEAKL